MSLLAGAMQGLGKGLEKYGDVKTNQYLEEQKMTAIEEMQLKGEERANTRADQVYDKQRKDSLADDQRKLKEGIAVDSYKRQQENDSPQAKANLAKTQAETNYIKTNKGSKGEADTFFKLSSAREDMLKRYTLEDEMGVKKLMPVSEWNESDQQLFNYYNAQLGLEAGEDPMAAIRKVLAERAAGGKPGVEPQENPTKKPGIIAGAMDSKPLKEPIMPGKFMQEDVIKKRYSSGVDTWKYDDDWVEYQKQLKAYKAQQK